MDRLSDGMKYAIVGFILTVLVPGIVSFIDSSHQENLNRQYIAKSMMDEMDSLNKELKIYANYYNDNMDLDSDGIHPVINPNTDNIIIVNNKFDNSTIPIVLFINSTEMHYKQAEVISSSRDRVSVKYPTMSGVIWVSDLNVSLTPPQLYPENGCYNLYIKEISQFEPNDAKVISQYYTMITNAESDRKHLLTTFESNRNDTILNGDQFNTYIDMRVNIINAVKFESYAYNSLKNEMKYRI